MTRMSTDADPPIKARCIALVSPGWPARAMANGIVSYVASVARGLEDQGVSCHVLTPRPMEETSEPFVHTVQPNVKSIGSRIMWRLRPESWPNQSFCTALIQKIEQLHRERGLQLVELEESYGWARLLAGRCPVPIVVRLHGPWFLNGVANGVAQDARFQQRNRWEKAGILAADGISAPSQHVLDETRRYFGLELPNARVIPNPVEPVGPADRWNLQACDRNRIVFVGRFDRHKGGDTMLDAFALLAKRLPDLTLDFIGPDRGCVDSDGREWKFDEYLRSRFSDADRARVCYHGFQPGPAIAGLRKRALVTLAPSRYETFGIAAAEAMMAGCPLVVCGAGALAELVQDGRNGLVAAPGDASDVAGKIESLLNDPQRAAELGARAACDAGERYTPQKIARQTMDFYRDVLVSRTRSAAPSLPVRTHSGRQAFQHE
jgi:glycosyltransferase involved in cell wall biosynthesis